MSGKRLRLAQAYRRVALIIAALISLAGARVSASVLTATAALGRIEAGWANWELRLQGALRPSPLLVSSARVTEKLVALTIDDGPDPRFTPHILTVLEAEKVPATFFAVGQNVLRYPELLRREYLDGDEIGNHTFTHPDLLQHDPGTAVWEMSQAERAIVMAIGQKPRYFRPPKGQLNREILDAANRAGMKVVLWSVALENHGLLTPEEMAERVVRQTRPGGIILMHDGRLDRTRSVEALPLVINGLRRRGYKFVTLTALLAADSRWRREPAHLLPRPAL